MEQKDHLIKQISDLWLLKYRISPNMPDLNGQSIEELKVMLKGLKKQEIMYRIELIKHQTTQLDIECPDYSSDMSYDDLRDAYGQLVDRITKHQRMNTIKTIKCSYSAMKSTIDRRISEIDDPEVTRVYKVLREALNVVYEADDETLYKIWSIQFTDSD